MIQRLKAEKGNKLISSVAKLITTLLTSDEMIVGQLTYSLAKLFNFLNVSVSHQLNGLLKRLELTASGTARFQMRTLEQVRIRARDEMQILEVTLKRSEKGQ